MELSRMQGRGIIGISEEAFCTEILTLVFEKRIIKQDKSSQTSSIYIGKEVKCDGKEKQLTGATLVLDICQPIRDSLPTIKMEHGMKVL